MKKKRKLSTVLLIVIALVGLSLLLYPTIANQWNEHINAQYLNSYTTTLQSMEKDDYRDIWNYAIAYNKALAGQDTGGIEVDTSEAGYARTLSIDGSGIMGYIDIPKINVTLAISHGTSDEVLSSGCGHIEWSSLPTGGEGNHCVLSAHRGLPSAKLFTDLDELKEGDDFVLNILNETLTYEVDQIRIVEPEDTSELSVVQGKDYCTLVTCTPYGINSHRLLVRGHRIQNLLDASRVVSEAVIIDEIIVASFLALPILLLLLVVILCKKPKPTVETARKHIQDKRK